ncbi:MAG: helix-turn-helix transcriptional regulator [Deltaproteobacteria bacterium]|nr:helix-turn-helix transcriptional regulator [Deltaproteobacteria bacterium]
MAVEPHESLERDLVLRLAEAGTEAETLVAFRARALELLRARVPFDRAAFHAFSPRVPLETGVFVDLDVSMLARSVGQWDAFAVELGRMRDLANAARVAWDREAFPPGSASRARFLALIGTPLRVRSMVIVHLIVRGTVRSVIALFGKNDDTFDASHVAFLQRVAPTLALADALLQHDEASPRAALRTKLACGDGRLTPRQRQIVEHVAMGHTNAEIATAMGLSPNTLRNHLAAIFTRVGASNRADLVRLAVLTPG